MGVSSSELWGAESVSGDTGLALEECWTASAKASSKVETSISPSVRSRSGGSLGGSSAVAVYSLSVALLTQPNVTILLG